jgi:hypothetical protein
MNRHIAIKVGYRQTHANELAIRNSVEGMKFSSKAINRSPLAPEDAYTQEHLNFIERPEKP